MTPNPTPNAYPGAQTVATLHRWADSGWLRRLDSALAAFVLELDTAAAPALLVSTALLAHMEGRGHTCLPLAALVSQPDAVLAWPEAAQPELSALWLQMPTQLADWLAALQASPAVRCVWSNNTDAAVPHWPGSTLPQGANPEPVFVGAQPSWRLPPAAQTAIAQRAGLLQGGPVQPMVHVEAAMAAAPAMPDTGQPLVLGGTPAQPLLYLRRYWLHEQQVARAVAERTAASQPVDEALARHWLDRLFDLPEADSAAPTTSVARTSPADAAAPDTAVPDPAPTQAAAPPAAVDWQKLACAVALRASLTVITGGPGTGKTYTAARLLALLFATHPDPQRLRVALAAPTGKAAARLRQAIDASLQSLSARLGADLDLPGFARRMGAARTLHALLGARPDTRQFRFTASHPLDIDILIVDEASMVHLEMMSALLQALPPTAKLILLGDKDQLASVEAGAVLGDLCRDADLGRYSAQTMRYAQQVAGQALPPTFCALNSAAPLLAQQTVMLRQSRRFGGQIGQLALAVNRGDAQRAQHLLTHDSSRALCAPAQPIVADVLNLAVRGRPGASACYGDYLRLIKARPASSSSSIVGAGASAAKTETKANAESEAKFTADAEADATNDVIANPYAKAEAATTTTDAAQHSAWVKSVLLAFDRFRLLCAVHDGDWGTRSLNQAVQQALAAAHLLRPSGEWFAGRPVMVTRNDPALGVFNGDVGVTLPASQGGALRVYFLDGDSLRSVGASRLPHVETAFAMTVHKSQGSEFLHTALVLPPGGARVLTRELVYTGITRARESFTLLEGQPGLLQQAIAQKSQRASGLEVL